MLSDAPYRGHLAVTLQRPATLRIRLPDGLRDDAAVRLSRDGAALPWRRDGLYLDAGPLPAGARVTLDYPLTRRTEEVTIGNPGREQYCYRVAWKGDSVTSIEPASEMPEMGYSDFDEKQVRIYFGEEGPGRLYQREAYLSDVAPRHAQPYEDHADALDLW